MQRTAYVTIRFDCEGDNEKIIRQILERYDGGIELNHWGEEYASYKLNKVTQVRLSRVKGGKRARILRHRNSKQ
jgi:hypothetical protein